ncbi:MAG: hypothetical protein H0U60_09815 [Blastocatellia bacterium]|nr:hypothetical protein [Blastocatellia bacterium]
MSFSSRTMGEQDWDEIHYFVPGEFKFPDKMGYEFMLWLDRVRASAKVEMRITSDYRSPQHNAEVGGAKKSSHMDVPCNVIDIGGVYEYYPEDPNWNRHRFAIIRAAMKLGCVRIGIYQNGSLHLDRTEDRRPSGLWVRVNGHP